MNMVRQVPDLSTTVSPLLSLLRRGDLSWGRCAAVCDALQAVIQTHDKVFPNRDLLNELATSSKAA